MVVPAKKKSVSSHVSLTSGGSVDAATRGSSAHSNVIEDLLQRTELYNQQERAMMADDSQPLLQESKPAST
ncbi:hypothetical protein LSTR_LSTR014272 [Laodelphax striatellus]|nr:hypothetical protein LSTR_LSTR014272 [Laodelphax striatellus]